MSVELYSILPCSWYSNNQLNKGNIRWKSYDFIPNSWWTETIREGALACMQKGGGHSLNSPLFNAMVQNKWVTKLPSTSGKLVKMKKSRDCLEGFLQPPTLSYFMSIYSENQK